MNGLLNVLSVKFNSASFITVHTFCASRDDPRNSFLLRTVPPNSKVFLRGLGKEDFNEG